MPLDDTPLEARLLREVIDWIEEKGRVPMLLAARAHVIGEMPGVPPEAEHVVLNVSARAVRSLEFGAESLSFSTGFGPVRSILTIPYGAVLQVASGNDEGFVGVVLRREPEVSAEPPSNVPPVTEENSRSEAKRRFRVVRDDEA